MPELKDKAPEAQPHQRIPTKDVPFLVLKCYHAEAVYRGDTVTHVLVDPESDVSAKVQAWRGDGWADTCEKDGGVRGIRHLQIEDRHGKRSFICVRPGFMARINADSVIFDSQADYASVLPNPGVPEAMAQLEADISAGLYQGLPGVFATMSK